MSATSPGCATAVRRMIGYFDHPALKASPDEPFPTSYTERYKRLAAVNRRNAGDHDRARLDAGWSSPAPGADAARRGHRRRDLRRDPR